MEPEQDDRYDPVYDDSILSLDDVRKSRLTLRQINRVRKAAELHQKEEEKELHFVKQMYGVSAEEESGVL